MKNKFLIVLFLCLSLVGCMEQPNENSNKTSVPPQGDVKVVFESGSPDEEGLEQTSESALEADILEAEAFNGYKLIVVDGGDLSGHREPNVVVDIGFGDREYWAYTNEYGQLIRVVAKQIIPQNAKSEPVNAKGRYYDDEAKVPGTELPNYDEGHVIADSLGGVANAYNITPQDSVLNRHGNQAYMEKVILDAGGATDFEAIITYPNTTTQIPSHYHYTYKINGVAVVEDFDNINPDEANRVLAESSQSGPEKDSWPDHDISSIDTNGDGLVSIKEAKAAGFEMPITKNHWLYSYMRDADGDGLVGE